MLAAAGCALVWANSPWAAGYQRLWNAQATIRIDSFVWRPSLESLINEGLMSVFFLVVGLEIRREAHSGALSNRRVAALPIVAALGGMLVPALIYLAVSRDPALRRGWAVPTATDIAFAVGVLALLGNRVPTALRALLLSVAVLDDIGAVLIIAFLYSTGLGLTGLLLAGCAMAGLLLLRSAAPHVWIAYALLGAVTWVGLKLAGVHPALAGVALGLLIPVGVAPGAPADTQPASERLQTVLHPWVAYGVMPLFALANAGVDLGSVSLGAPTTRLLLWSVVCAMVVGKPVGILLATFAGVRLRWCELPRGVTRRGLLLVGCLAGIGFTMSIFVAALAFDDRGLRSAAKLGVIIASAVSALLGLWVGRVSLRVPISRLTPSAHRSVESAIPPTPPSAS